MGELTLNVLVGVGEKFYLALPPSLPRYTPRHVACYGILTGSNNDRKITGQVYSLLINRGKKTLPTQTHTNKHRGSEGAGRGAGRGRGRGPAATY